MPVPLHGKDYYTVAERLASAHGNSYPVGVTRIETEFLAFGTSGLCKATVTFADGQVFTGHAEVPLDSKQPAERDAPHECAETSAVGRALAMAGYSGSEAGLAGAEEVQRPPRRQYDDGVPPEIAQDTRRLAQTPSGNGHQDRPASDDRWGNPPPTDAQQKALYVLGKKTGHDIPEGLTRQSASELIGRLDALAKGAPR